jgi:CheY-like chemotaxis protein
MPELDGFGVAERIKQHPELRHASIMMLTSGASSGDLARCRNLGIGAHLIKPVRPSELLETILRVLGKAHPPLNRDSSRQSLPSTPNYKLNILVAEDNTINQKVALSLLEKQGHSVVLAGTGLEAISQWNSGNFDLILMDVQLPEMDGLAATAMIRETELTTGRRIPIVAMTAHAMKGDRERCLAAGVDDYISKPIHAEELYRVIGMVTGSNTEVIQPQKDEPCEILTSSNSYVRNEFDLEDALMRMGGDRKLMKQASAIFLEIYPSLMSNVRTAFDKRDGDALEQASHSLKGSISHFGAPFACDLASQLEIMGRDANLDLDDKVVTTLELEVARVATAVAGMERQLG